MYKIMIIDFVCLRNQKKTCALCNKSIDAAKYTNHIAHCRQEDEDNEVQSEAKKCILCGEEVRDLKRHIENCSGSNDGQSPVQPVSSYDKVIFHFR
jgi:hypothetical protein